jgi:ribosome recycling factor
MASKRMFCHDIIKSGEFISMSHSAQALYFHLNLFADDDGYVDYTLPTLGVRCNESHVHELQQHGFVYVFDHLVLYILRWDLHNTVKHYKKGIFIDRYPYKENELKQSVMQYGTEVEPNRRQDGAKQAPKEVQGGDLDKIRVDKIRRDEKKETAVDLIIDKVILFWNDLSGESRELSTEYFRTDIKGRIKQLKKEREIKDNDKIEAVFFLTFEFKKAQADDPQYFMFKMEAWNLKTLIRKSNFLRYYDEYLESKKKKETKVNRIFNKSGGIDEYLGDEGATK